MEEIKKKSFSLQGWDVLRGVLGANRLRQGRLGYVEKDEEKDLVVRGKETNNRWPYYVPAHIYVYARGLVKATFTLQQLPGCCGIGLLSGVWYDKEGIQPLIWGQAILRFAEWWATETGFTRLMVTDWVKSPYDEGEAGKIAKVWDPSYRVIESFVNRNSENTVEIRVKEIEGK